MLNSMQHHLVNVTSMHSGNLYRLIIKVAIADSWPIMLAIYTSPNKGLLL